PTNGRGGPAHGGHPGRGGAPRRMPGAGGGLRRRGRPDHPGWHLDRACRRTDLPEPPGHHGDVRPLALMPYVERPDGCRLYFELRGPADGTPLLLLEGLGGDIPGWRRNIPRLSQRHQVIAFDFRGNGRSDKPDQPETMATFVDDTAGLLDHLGARQAHVYGQSFGGMVAQELALTHPSRVRSLILAATSPGGSVAVRSRPRVPKDRPWLQLYSERFAREHPDHVREDLRVGGRHPQTSEAARL